MDNFTVGDRCLVHLLESDAGQPLNGQHVTLVDAIIEKGRFQGKFDDGSFANIKPCNLQIIRDNRDNQNTKNKKDPSSDLDKQDKTKKKVTTDDNDKKKKEAEDKEDCPICCDALPKLGHQFTRLICCGKGLHYKCANDLDATECMTWEQKHTCIMCRSKDVAKGSKEEIERLRGWIKKGKGWALCMLAERYRDGLGVKQSDKKAMELYEKAAKKGHATAQYNLGGFYELGMYGLTQSDKRAIELYTLAAEQGHAFAQFNLGCMHANGQGVIKSYRRARELWTKAATQGHEKAIKFLKMMDEEEQEERSKSTTTTPPKVVDPNTITCSTCGKPQTEIFKLKKCACRITQYCNKQCQKKHRKQHKKECTYRVKEKKKKKKNEQDMKGDGTKDGKKEIPIQEEEDKEDCPICTDALPKLSGQFARLTCCGKGLHDKCHADLVATKCMTWEQKMTCIMCRTKMVAGGSKKEIERLRNRR